MVMKQIYLAECTNLRLIILSIILKTNLFKKLNYYIHLLCLRKNMPFHVYKYIYLFLLCVGKRNRRLINLIFFIYYNLSYIDIQKQNWFGDGYLIEQMNDVN